MIEDPIIAAILLVYLLAVGIALDISEKRHTRRLIEERENMKRSVANMARRIINRTKR